MWLNSVAEKLQFSLKLHKKYIKALLMLYYLDEADQTWLMSGLPSPVSSFFVCQFYRPLNVRVALLGLEIWSDQDKILVDKSPTDTLNRFLEWRTRELLPRLRHDNAQLVM